MKLFLFFAVLSMAFFSCHSSAPKMVDKTDTVLINARGADNFIFSDSAIRTVSTTFLPTDSSSTTGKWGFRTSYRLLQPIDIKMNGKDTVFGRNHTVLYNFAYSQTPVNDSLIKYILVVDLPLHPSSSAIIFKADKVIYDTARKN